MTPDPASLGRPASRSGWQGTSRSKAGKARLGLDVAAAGEAILSDLDSQGTSCLTVDMGEDGNLGQRGGDEDGKYIHRAIGP